MGENKVRELGGNAKVSHNVIPDPDPGSQLVTSQVRS